MKTNSVKVLLIAMFLLPYWRVAAQSGKDSVALEEVHIATLRTNSRIELVPTRIEVLGAEELEEENGIKPGNITSLLGDIAGIQIQQVSAGSGNTMARIQGLNGRYTQIMRDGIPLFGGLSSGFTILQIPPLDIKQIEIIRGSASTLYGGDAIGGIINIISKDPLEKPQLSVTFNGTTLKENNTNIYFAIRKKKLGFTVFGGQTFQKAVDTDHDGLSDVTSLGQSVFHPRLFWYLNEKTTVVISYAATLDARMGGDMKRIENIDANANYYLKTFIDRHQQDVRFTHRYNKRNEFTAKICRSYFHQSLSSNAYPFEAKQIGYYSELSWMHTHGRSVWNGGVNLNSDALYQQSNATPNYNYTYFTRGMFLQNNWNINNKTILETGLRADYHTLGWFILPRIALLVRHNETWSSRISGGDGYKVPTLVSYVNPESDLNAVANNTTLNPERSRGFNADINYHHLFENRINLTVNQSFFYTELRSPVFDSLNTGIIYLQNAEKSLYTKGMQTYLRLRYLHSELYLGYVFTQVLKSYDALHKNMAVTPKHNLSAVLFYEAEDDFRLGMECAYIAGQLDQNYQPVKNYLLLAAMVQYEWKQVTFVLNGENLLDFRQNKWGRVYDGTTLNPSFHKFWAPVDGRVINLSARISIL